MSIVKLNIQEILNKYENDSEISGGRAKKLAVKRLSPSSKKVSPRSKKVSPTSKKSSIASLKSIGKDLGEKLMKDEITNKILKIVQEEVSKRIEDEIEKRFGSFIEKYENLIQDVENLKTMLEEIDN